MPSFSFFLPPAAPRPCFRDILTSPPSRLKSRIFVQVKPLTHSTDRFLPDPSIYCSLFIVIVTLNMTRQYQTSVISRERNRVHARKTRQRKKEQMQTLTNRADDLKSEQIRLKQNINEKNTASILVGLFSSTGGEQQVEDPRVEALMRRPADEIPDAANLPELPALILPGQHNSKKHQDPDVIAPKDELPNDGIDYDLLGKDRAKCSPAELDQIRRERNRMHAKRTRDRKRLFMEEMADMCKKLHEENEVLLDHLDGLNGRPSKRKELSGSIVSPTLSSSKPELSPTELSMPSKDQAATSQHGVSFDQMKNLLEAATTFSSAVSESTNPSEVGSDSDHGGNHASKRRRFDSETKSSSHVPNSITTTRMSAAVGC
jgi:hypothetical protein